MAKIIKNRKEKAKFEEKPQFANFPIFSGFTVFLQFLHLFFVFYYFEWNLIFNTLKNTPKQFKGIFLIVYQKNLNLISNQVEKHSFALIKFSHPWSRLSQFVHSNSLRFPVKLNEKNWQPALLGGGSMA